MTTYVGTICSRILARLLYGTLNAKSLHILVGCNLRIDVVPLENLCERHTQKEQADKRLLATEVLIAITATAILFSVGAKNLILEISSPMATERNIASMNTTYPE